MTITVNGVPRETPAGVTVADLLAELGVDGRGIAVAVDDDLCTRDRWAEPLGDGVSVEVLTAVQGG